MAKALSYFDTSVFSNMDETELNNFTNWLNSEGYTISDFPSDYASRVMLLANIYNNKYLKDNPNYSEEPMGSSYWEGYKQQKELWQLLMSNGDFTDSLMSKTSQNNPNSDFNFEDLITQGYTLDYDPETGVGTLTDPDGQISTLQSVSSTIGDIDLNGDGKKLIFVPQSGNTTELDFLSVPATQRELPDLDTSLNTSLDVSDEEKKKEEDKEEDKKEDIVIPDPIIVTPSSVDESVYTSLPEDLALALSPIDRAWTPANNFLNAASIVNPGAALAYGLTTVGGDVAQALLDNANIDVPITYDRATDERTLNRYADLLGADIVKTDGNYGLKYSKEAAERAGLSQPTTGGTSRNAIRAIFDLEPFETDFLVPDNLFDYAAESDYEESKYINRSENPQTFESNKSSSYSGLNTGTSGTGTSEDKTDDLLNQSKTGSKFTAGTS